MNSKSLGELKPRTEKGWYEKLLTINAEAAINFKRALNGRLDDNTTRNFSGCFLWETTPQGHNYWSNIFILSCTDEPPEIW